MLSNWWSVCERVIGYGWTDDDGAYIDGYYVLTNNYKLFYNLEEKFLYKEEWRVNPIGDGTCLENSWGVKALGRSTRPLSAFGM